MSRTFAALTTAFAFTALLATGANAQSAAPMPMQERAPAAQAPMHGEMHRGHHREMHRGHHREGRAERRAMRREMRADRRAAQNPDAAYMGGGAVYERLPDGTLRPVM